MTGRRNWVLVKAKTLFDYDNDDDDDEEEKTSEEQIEEAKDLLSVLTGGGKNLLPEFGGGSEKPKAPPSRTSQARKVRVKAPAKAPTPAAPSADGTHLAVVGDMNWGKIPDSDLSPLDPENRLEDQYDYMGVIDDKLSEWVNQHGMPDSIITGGVGGIDEMVERWANDNDVPVTAFPPDFQAHGKYNALPMRNQAMLEGATHVLGLNHPMGDGGTMNALQMAMESGKPAHMHNLLADPSTPLRPVNNSSEKAPTEDWYREFIGDDKDVRGKRVKVITPAQRAKLDSMSSGQRLNEAIGRVHGREFKTGRMNLQSKRQREAGVKDTERVEGLPMRAPMTRYTTRSLPRDERTAEEKENDRLLDMARTLGEGMGGNVTVEGEKSQERTPQQQMLDRRRERERKNAERAAGNLPVDPKGSVQTPQQRSMEERMRDDMAAFAEEGKSRGTPAATKRRAPSTPAKRAAPKSLFDVDEDDDQKNAGEPIDMAWRLLKSMLVKLDWDEDPENMSSEEELEERLRGGRSKSTHEIRPGRSIRQENERQKIQDQNEGRWGNAGKNSGTGAKRAAYRQKVAEAEARKREREERQERERSWDAMETHPGSPLTNEEYMGNLTDIQPHQIPLPKRNKSYKNLYSENELAFIFNSMVRDYMLSEDAANELMQQLIDGDISYHDIDAAARSRMIRDTRNAEERGYRGIGDLLAPASQRAGENRDLRHINNDDVFNTAEFYRRILTERPHMLDGSIPPDIQQVLDRMDPEEVEHLRQMGAIPEPSGITLGFEDGELTPKIVANPHNEEDMNWIESLHEEMSDMPTAGRRRKDANVAFENPDGEPDMDSGFPETLGINVPGEYDQNMRRQLVDSFQGLPWNEETGFTRGDPIDMAWDSLLKKR